MFFTEEDITPAVQAAEELFGPSGTMSESKTTKRNVFIGTARFGKIWYGDVDTSVDMNSMLNILSQKIGQPALIVTESF